MQKTWIQRSYDEKFPFVYAAELGLASAVFRLLDRDPPVLDPKAKKGAKPERAIFTRQFLDGALLANCKGETDPELVQRLLQEGAKVNTMDDFDNTPLHYAAMAPQDKVKDKFLWTQRSHTIKLLIDAGADLDVQNESGETALLQACMTHNEKGAFLIAAKGADLSCIEKWMTRINKIGVQQSKDGKKNRSGEITCVALTHTAGRVAYYDRGQTRRATHTLFARGVVESCQVFIFIHAKCIWGIICVFVVVSCFFLCAADGLVGPCWRALLFPARTSWRG